MSLHILPPEISRPAGEHIGYTGNEFTRRSQKRRVVKWIQPVRDFVKDEIHAKHRAGMQQVVYTHIALVGDIFGINPQVSAALTGYIGHAVAGTGRHADDVIRLYPLIHQAVEHTAGIQATHAAAFEY